MSYQQLHEQAIKLSHAQQEIESQLASLKSQVEALVMEGFVTDSSSRAFQIAYDEFMQGATKTIDGLGGMASYLKLAAQTFADADQQLARRLEVD